MGFAVGAAPPRVSRTKAEGGSSGAATAVARAGGAGPATESEGGKGKKKKKKRGEDSDSGSEGEWLPPGAKRTRRSSAASPPTGGGTAGAAPGTSHGPGQASGAGAAAAAAAAATAAGLAAVASPRKKCGECKHCLNPQLKKGCLVLKALVGARREGAIARRAPGPGEGWDAARALTRRCVGRNAW